VVWDGLAGGGGRKRRAGARPGAGPGRWRARGRQGGLGESVILARMGSRTLRRMAFGAVAVYLAVAVPVALRNTFLRLRWAAGTAGLPEGAVRERVLGRPYVSAIERIRRAIPADEPYLVTEREEYAVAWVRFDLLPRPVIDARPRGWHPEGCAQQQVRWLVVAGGAHRPPLLLERAAGVPAGCAPAPWLGRAR
jgi:hypothetical protein